MARQVDHQDQCALIAAAWGNDDFRRPEPYGPLVTAAAVHDEGWRLWERAPRVDAAGRPVDFPDLDRAVHVVLYTYGIDLAAARDPRVGLVVCMHGRGLYEKRLGLDGPAPDRATRPARERRFIEAEEARQARLEAAIGTDVGDWAWAAFRLLQAWDVLSLYLVWRGLRSGGRWILPQVPRRPGDPGVSLTVTPAGPDACHVDPWPFGPDEVALPIRVREIPDRPYTDRTLAEALDAAPWREVPYRAVRPGG